MVAVGSSIEASVLITANLVDLKDPADLGEGDLAVARQDPRPASAPTTSSTPRPRPASASRTSCPGRMLDFIEFDDDFALVKMYPPKETVGFTLDESKVRSKYGVTIVGVKITRRRLHLRPARTPRSPAATC